MRERVKRRAIWVALTASIFLTLLASNGFLAVYAQDGGTDQSTPGAEIVDPVGQEPEPTLATEPDPTFVPTQEIQPTGDDTSVELPAEAANPDSETPETLPQDSVEKSTLVVTPDGSPDCVLADGFEEAAITAGGYLDYRCSYALSLSGEGVSVEDIAVTYSISTLVPDGLSVRYRTNLYDELAWGAPLRSEAILNDYEIDASAVEFSLSSGDSIVGTVTLTFFISVERDQCSNVEGDLTLNVAGVAKTPARTDVVVTQSEPMAGSMSLSPSFTPFQSIAPLLHLTELSITPVQFSLGDQITNGVMNLVIENSAYLCSSFQLEVALVSQATNAAGVLSVVSNDGAVVTYLIETGTTLDQFVVIGELPAGTQPGSYSVTVSFDLTVPGGLMAGSFEVTASTSVHLQSD